MKNESPSNRREALAILAVAPYSRLTTFKRDGTGVGVPIWHAVSGDKVVMFSEATAWKVKRLRRDPRIEITTCDWRGRTDGRPTWRGTGRVLEGRADIARAYAALDAKYGWQKWLTDAMSRLSGRYDRRALLEFTLDD